MRITINGTPVNYSDRGKGEVLVAVHGWMHDHTSFDELTDILENNYRVVSVDLPNFGKSGTNPNITSQKSYATFLRDFTEKLKITDYSLVGHSMGGQIVAYATAQSYVNPRKLILLAPSGVRSLRPLKRKVLQAFAVPVGQLTPARLRPIVLKVLGTDYSPDLPPEHKKVIRRVLKKDIQKIVRRISVPTLLIFGADDIFTTMAMGEVLQKNISDSRLEVLSGVRHRLQQTAAPQVAKLIQGFLS